MGPLHKPVKVLVDSNPQLLVMHKLSGLHLTMSLIKRQTVLGLTWPLEEHHLLLISIWTTKPLSATYSIHPYSLSIYYSIHQTHIVLIYQQGCWPEPCQRHYRNKDRWHQLCPSKCYPALPQLLFTPPPVVLLPFPVCLGWAFFNHSWHLLQSKKKDCWEDVNLDACSKVKLAFHISAFLGSLFFLWLVCCIIYTFHKRGGEPSGFGAQPKLVRLSTELR